MWQLPLHFLASDSAHPHNILTTTVLKCHLMRGLCELTMAWTPPPQKKVSNWNDVGMFISKAMILSNPPPPLQ